ncbi:MAG: hypothetical protein ABI467_17145 [Kofleriaceae bacterium]
MNKVKRPPSLSSEGAAAALTVGASGSSWMMTADPAPAIPEPEPELEPAPDADPDAVPDAVPDAGPDADADPDPAAEAEPEPDPAPATAEPEPEPEPATPPDGCAFTLVLASDAINTIRRAAPR